MTDPVHTFFLNTPDDEKREVYNRALAKTQLEQERMSTDNIEKIVEEFEKKHKNLHLGQELLDGWTGMSEVKDWLRTTLTTYGELVRREERRGYGKWPVMFVYPTEMLMLMG